MDTIADALADSGYIILDHALPASLLDNLVAHFQVLQIDEFKVAGIGRKAQLQVAQSVRSDKIHWIESDTFATAQFLRWMENLRLGINQRLFLGLFDYESHFAQYDAGAFYKKHLDAFKGQSVRVLSTVLYLNRNWLPEYGGELVLYSEAGDQVLEKVLPVFGRLIIFLSEKFPHEVVPARCQRNSIAGWFRVNQP